MARRVKDFIEISEFTSLDDLIKYLSIIRDTVPPEGEPELKIRGDEIFGHRLTISYLRDLTDDEAALEAKYSDAKADESIEKLRSKLDKVPYSKTGRRRP